jgi:hypothetical protein
MILIFSAIYDRSTHEVIKWINSKKEKYLFINMSYSIDEINIELKNNYMFLGFIFKNKSHIKINMQESISWYRRGSLIFLLKDPQNNRLRDYLYTEVKGVEYSIYKLLETNNRCLGSAIGSTEHRKLHDLYLASLCGLTIPDTYITQNKEKATAFWSRHNESVITKGIVDVPPFPNGASHYVTRKHLDFAASKFMPTKMQNCIQKKAELRIFYLKGKFYSMAMFTQVEGLPTNDYRMLDNYHKIYRNVPFQLPLEVEQKIEQFMQLAKLNTGSIDVILTPDNQFVFLEVNPAGQFDWLSKSCNYYVEEAIANELIKMSKDATTN